MTARAIAAAGIAAAAVAAAAALLLARTARPGDGPVLPAAPGADPLATVLEDLRDRDPLRRLRAARAGLDLGDPAFAGPLAAAMGSERDPDLRLGFAAARARLEGPDGERACHALLTDGDSRARRLAVETAAARGLAVPATLWPALLGDADPLVRLAAAEAAAALGDRAAAGPLAAALSGRAGPETPTLLLAAARLGLPGAPEAVGRALGLPALHAPASRAAVALGAAAIPVLE
ncbi:MAG: hypothetical protein L0216_04780, partial [Planctomycetales bacterium]|nr:hypothetical protein [Planctomycetales bacterium]